MEQNKPFSEFSEWFDKKAAQKADELKPGQEAGKAEGEKGMAAAASANPSLLEAAQSVARRLGRDGPVTIDDVIHEMRRLGYKESDIKAGDRKAKNWKGSVFAESIWVCVGSIASREKSAHGRHVRQWATKAWLRSNPVNGTENDASAFSLYRIWEEASHLYPAGEELCFVIGREALDSKFDELRYPKPRQLPDGRVEYGASLKLYGCHVYPINGVGALCVPRRYLEGELRSSVMMDRSMR